MRTVMTLFIVGAYLFSQNAHISARVSAQSDETFNVWIYLKDKNETPAEKHLNDAQRVLRGSANVDFRDVPVTPDYVEEIRSKVTTFRHQLKWFNAVTATVTKAQLEGLSRLPYVQNIDLVRKLKRKLIEPSSETTTPSRSKMMANIDYGTSAPQYNLIDVPEVHDLGYTGKGVIIGVFDGGFNNLTHEALAPLDIQATWDFVSNDSDVGDSGYSSGEGDHGTETLSCMAGYKPGRLVGPAFKSSFLLAKTEYGPTETTQEEDNYAAALEWAEARGVWIVSSSLGYRDFDNSSDSYSWQDFNGDTAISTKASDIAASKGILVITSAGNSGDGSNNTLGAPADGDSVLAVGATNSSGTRVSFSSVGPSADGRVKPDVMAQGSSVKVSSPNSNTGYLNVNGTSFSCPITAGSAALLFEANPFATNMDIFHVLRNTANNTASPNKYYGYGVINVLNAFNDIKLIHHTPVSSVNDPNSAIQITAQVKNAYVSRYSSFQLKYKTVGSGSYASANFSQSSQDSQFTYYTASIPAPGSAGTLNYYLTATNGTRTASVPPNHDTNPYAITVGTGGNNPPTLNDLSNLTIQENAGQQSVNLSGISDGDGGSQVLTITVTSSNTALISNPTVSYTNGASTGTLSFAPVNNQTGNSTLTVTVQDNGTGSNSVQKSFVVTVESGSGGPNNYEPNNSFTEAKSIPTDQLVSSFIQSNGDEDYFYFDLAKTGALRITLANFPGDYDFFLYNSSQAEVARAYTTSDPEVVDYNVTVAGRYYVKVDGYQSANSSTDDYELTVHFSPDVTFDDWVLTDQVIESAHNYSNYTNDTKTYSHAGAIKVGVHFSRLETEKNYDYIYIKDKNNTTTATYHGTVDAFWAIVDGDAININLVTDYSVTKYGYKIDQVGYYTGTTVNHAGVMSGETSMKELTQLNVKKSVEIDPLATKISGSSVVPTSYSVSDPFPNPFNPITTIAIDLDVASQLEVEIINTLGQRVKQLFSGHLNAGSNYSFLWDATNRAGVKVSSGMYFYKVRKNNSQTIKRIVLMK